jgi:hypothetical protein
MDSDAAAYIAAVETADGQALQYPVKLAIDAFVVGCKADGIWTPIKSACFLRGPRTLAGASVPLVGTAPTNVNFSSGDYSQFSGLVGNGSTKYLNSNRAANADPQDNNHASVWVTTNSGTGSYLFARSLGSGVGDTSVAPAIASNYPFRSRLSAFDAPSQGTRSTASATGFVGMARSASGSFVSRVSGSNETITSTSGTRPTETYGVFARRRSDTGTIDSYTSSRLAWYSIGESLNLALLDARLTTYMNDILKPITNQRRAAQTSIRSTF